MFVFITHPAPSSGEHSSLPCGTSFILNCHKTDRKNTAGNQTCRGLFYCMIDNTIIFCAAGTVFWAGIITVFGRKAYVARMKEKEYDFLFKVVYSGWYQNWRRVPSP